MYSDHPACVRATLFKHIREASGIIRIGHVAPLALAVLLSGCGGHTYGGLDNFVNLAKKVRATVVNISAASRPLAPTAIKNSTQAAGSQGEPPWLRKYLAKSSRQAANAAHGEGNGANRPVASYGDRNERGGTPYRSVGSGVVLSADGYILTDDHAVFRLNRIVVRFSNGRVAPARLIGADRTTNLALLKVNASGLPAARIADDRALEVGKWVLSVGLPPRSSETVAAGIVSAVHRVFSSEPYVPFIQTDAILGPDNLGGPLFNARGRLVGIVSPPPPDGGKRVGQSFAVPIGLAMMVVNDLKSTGKVNRGWLGVVVQEVTPDLAQSLGMNIPQGALVTRVMRDSPAAQSGLQPGDVILAFNGEVLRNSADLPPLVGASEPGQTVNLRLLRNGKIVTLTVELGSLSQFGSEGRQFHESEPSASKSVSSSAGVSDRRFESTWLGMHATDIAQSRDVVIAEVSASGKVAKAGPRPVNVPIRTGGDTKLRIGFNGAADCLMAIHDSRVPSRFTANSCS